MPQQLKALASKNDNLSSIPGTHTVDEQSQLLWGCRLTSKQMSWCAHMHRHSPQPNQQQLRTDKKLK